jgi:hypothetical protein
MQIHKNYWTWECGMDGRKINLKLSHCNIQDLRLSWQQTFELWSSGFWHHAVMQVVTKTYKEQTASIYKCEDGGKMFLWNAGNHLPDDMVSQPQRPQSTPQHTTTSRLCGKSVEDTWGWKFRILPSQRTIWPNPAQTWSLYSAVSHTPPTPNYLLFQPEWSLIYLQSAPTIISLIHVSFNA